MREVRRWEHSKIYPPDFILAQRSCQALPPEGRLWPSGDDDEVQYDNDEEEDGGDGDGDGDEVQYDKDDHGDDIDGSLHNLEGKSVLFAARCWS